MIDTISCNPNLTCIPKPTTPFQYNSKNSKLRKMKLEMYIKINFCILIQNRVRMCHLPYTVVTGYNQVILIEEIYY